MLLQSAQDIEVPGVDRLSGYGLLDAKAALAADPAFFVEAAIQRLGIVKIKGKAYIQVSGTATADKLAKAWIEIGKGPDPKKWKKVVTPLSKGVAQGPLFNIQAKHFKGAKVWTVRLITQHKSGRQRENRYTLKLG